MPRSPSRLGIHLVNTDWVPMLFFLQTNCGFYLCTMLSAAPHCPNVMLWLLTMTIRRLSSQALGRVSADAVDQGCIWIPHVFCVRATGKFFKQQKNWEFGRPRLASMNTGLCGRMVLKQNECYQPVVLQAFWGGD